MAVRPRSSAPPESVAPSTPPGGDIGPYKLANRIAVGGMAEVFRALQPRTAGEARTVVIKKMLPSLAAESECRAMFEEEARLGLAISHANVVQVLDYGTDGNAPYIALEWVLGVDLWRLLRWLRQNEAGLATDLALYVSTEFLAGLQAVHEARDANGALLEIVHRDVSPSNVFLSVHGDVKLGDLGIAQAELRESRPHPHMADRAKGKLSYLSPEQVAGDRVDRRSDIFSAASVIAELFLGAPLFFGTSEIAVLLAIRDVQVEALYHMDPSVPREVIDVLLRALKRDPGARIQTAAQMREELTAQMSRDVAQLKKELGELVTGALDEGGEHGTARAALERAALATTNQLKFSPSHGSIPPTRDELRAAPHIHDMKSIPPPGRNATPTTRPKGASTRRLAETTQVFDLSNGGILRALARNFVRRETGLLLCEQGAVRKEIYLRHGVPEFVTSNMASELLGEYLVKKGVIEREELDLALAVLPRHDNRLGDTLSALGLIEPVHVFRHIATQVREKLLEIFTWEHGQGAFYPGVEPPDDGFPLGLDAWEVLDAGLRRRMERGLEDRTLEAKRSNILRTRPNPSDPLVATLSAAPPHIRTTLDSISAPRSLVELESIHPPQHDPAQTRRDALVLIAMGAVEWGHDPGA